MLTKASDSFLCYYSLLWLSLSPSFLLLTNTSFLRCACRGDVLAMQVTDAGVAPCFRLSGGHQEVVRSFHWDSQGGALLTGGEDARLCLWRAAVPAQAPSMPSPSANAKVRPPPSRGHHRR